MAIVNCPECNKKMSDKAAVCEHCGFVVDGLDANTLERKRRRARADYINKLTAQSMLAMLVFVVGIGGLFYFRDDTSPDPTWQSQISIGLMAIGFIWYIVNRVRLLNTRRK
ncbi:zinc ribbon domain-containing protein [Aliidiomarina soli]|uniref:Zinc ribbon domain-containing protein n=1 Tax=Aliidiomarina soli TaxID=1928574 RepID=A0A432WMD1_9GAMM|nr:zinc ribbon domain-containing protein [Aliidiomarina soli]RUO34935.1 hypothetical protein CWE14_02775 [Aliidiomarina soli]